MLAKWLKSVTLAVASQDPTNQYSAFLGFVNLLLGRYIVMLDMSHLLVPSFLDLLLRLRAAVFVNLVAMRGFMSDADNGHITLSPNNLLGLQRANYLFHTALNNYMDAINTLAVHLCDC